LVADVVVVVGVVGESDIDGPDSLGFGAADASAVAPMMTMPARQLVAKSLRIMIHTLFQARTLGAPTPWVRMASAIGFNCSPSHNGQAAWSACGDDHHDDDEPALGREPTYESMTLEGEALLAPALRQRCVS